MADSDGGSRIKEVTKAMERREGSLERKELSPRTKSNLAVVPCKFFKQSICTAGDACPFSHDMPSPGGKTICPWYLKGKNNCKFGHKCALAHILPGEPMSNDRKNKRAQQLAQRETILLPDADSNDRGRSARRADNSDSQFAGRSASFDAAGSPSGASPPRMYATSRPQTENTSYAAALSHAPSTAFVPSVTESAIRSTSVGTDPRPIAVSNGTRHLSPDPHRGSPLFGTSPFSPPGTSSVFFSGSRGSDEESLETMPREQRRIARSRALIGGNSEANRGTAHQAALEADYEDLGTSRHEEDCLPSSLSDLMTPDERQRRQRRLASKATPSSEISAFSRSAPFAPPLLSPSLSMDSILSMSPHDAMAQPVYARNGSPGSLLPTPVGRTLLASHLPGSSLPPGLAAGLSRLHLQAANYTGETPPPSQGPSPNSVAMHGFPQARSGANFGVGSPLARGTWQHSPAIHAEEARSPSTRKESSTSFDGDEMPFELEY